MTLGSAASVAYDTLYGFTRFLTHTTGNSAAISDAQLLALINQEYFDLQMLLLQEINTGWKVGENEATGNLVASQNNYTFTTSLSTADVMSIDRVELRYSTGDNKYVVATPRRHHDFKNPLENVDNDAAVEGSKTAPYYYMFGNDTLIIDPIPDAAVTSGIKVYLTKLVTALSADGDEPVTIEQSHRLICYNAAMKWLKTKSQFDLAASHKEDHDRIEAMVIKHYTNRVVDSKPTFTRHYDSILDNFSS